MKKTFLWLAAAALASGCWTFCESEYPATAVTEARGAATNLTLKVEGFEATVTGVESVHEYSTVYAPGYIGRRRYHPGYYGTVHTCTLVPTARATDAFLKRAKDALEDAGFVLNGGTGTPDYVVEVRFGGPVTSSGDACACWAWRLCTVFFCDYAAESWTAKLRIRDNRTGRIAFHHDYVQRYETNAFGLIPIFGIAGCAETSSAHMQGWCLAALTDRAVADVTAFLSR